MHEKISFNGWPNCLRLWNDKIDVVVATDIGPRILRYGFLGEQNMLHLRAADAGRTGGSDWRIYGGHRLWLAPEHLPGSYYPDNGPVAFTISDRSVKIIQSMEQTSGIVKEMEITIGASGPEITIVHRITNKSASSLSVSPWAITVLAPEGIAILPQEPFGEEDDFLLPSRGLVLWQYTQMNDPRWEWGNEYILARQNKRIKSAQKIGILNKQGWAAYSLHEQLFIKQFAYTSGQLYPDFNSNNELYFNDEFLEIESLAPTTTLVPEEAAEHLETWTLLRTLPDADMAVITEKISQLFPPVPAT